MAISDFIRLRKLGYKRLAGGYGIGYSEPLTCRFGQVDSSKRCIEVKIQLSEVG